MVLTINGKAKLVVQDASSYQQLLETIDRLKAIEGIRRGLAEMRADKGKPLDQVDKAIARSTASTERMTYHSGLISPFSSVAAGRLASKRRRFIMKHVG